MNYQSEYRKLIDFETTRQKKELYGSQQALWASHYLSCIKAAKLEKQDQIVNTLFHSMKKNNVIPNEILTSYWIEDALKTREGESDLQDEWNRGSVTLLEEYSSFVNEPLHTIDHLFRLTLELRKELK